MHSARLVMFWGSMMTPGRAEGRLAISQRIPHACELTLNRPVRCAVAYHVRSAVGLRSDVGTCLLLHAGSERTSLHTCLFSRSLLPLPAGSVVHVLALLLQRFRSRSCVHLQK